MFYAFLKVGNYYELQEKNGDFAEFLRNYANTEEDEIFEDDVDGKLFSQFQILSPTKTSALLTDACISPSL